jgi:hypothetical protein
MTLLTTLTESTKEYTDKQVEELTQTEMRTMLSDAKASKEEIARVGQCSDTMKRTIIEDRAKAMVESERVFLQSLLAANYPKATSELNGRTWTVQLDGDGQVDIAPIGRDG